MRSMTGYGRSRLERDGREMTVEVKTVNHRFLDTNLRVPRGLLYLEEVVRKAVSVRLSRGRVEIFFSYSNSREDARMVAVDASLVRSLWEAYDMIIAMTGVGDDRSVSHIAAQGDVLTVTEGEDDQEAVTALCLDTLSFALDRLVIMREEEGRALEEDMSARLSCLGLITEKIGLRAPEVVADYKARLTARIAELLDAPPDPQRLAQEIAMFADRAAIDEELVRLSSHCAQIRDAFASAEPVGRKLDFLVQELNREINTIGSKASDLTITGLVVEAKAEIEKIREQVQNIE